MELMTSYSFLINSLEVYIYFWEGVVSQLIRPLSVSINGCKYMYILEDSGNSIILVTYGVTKVTWRILLTTPWASATSNR